MLAVLNHHLDAAKLLISLGANPKLKHLSGADLITLSLLNPKDPSLDTFSYVVDLGLDI